MPVGPYQVTARAVASGSYVWQAYGVDPWTTGGTLSPLAPQQVVVDYRLQPGTLQVAPVTYSDGTPASGFGARLIWDGDAWSPAQTLSFSETGGTWSTPPGRYRLDLDPGWTVVSATPTPPLTLASGGSVTLKLVVQPPALLLDLSTTLQGPNNGLLPLVCIYPGKPDGSEGTAPPTAEVYTCP